MKSFITVSKKAPDFFKYLDGTFSHTQVAIPIESLNLNSNNESVTFEIRDRTQVIKPSLKELLVALFKVHKFLYVLFPIFYISMYYFVHEWSFDVVTLLFAGVASLFLFIGVNLRSDYWDHIKGLDRVIKSNQSKPIAQGWIKAITVKRISLLFMVVALVLSFPVIIAFPLVLSVIALSIAIIYLGLLQKKGFYRDYFLGDLFWVLLVGPILSLGFEISLSGNYHGHFILFGLVWGALLFFRIQLSNFEFILAGSLAGVKNPINYFGFENSKKFILGSWMFFIFSFSLFHLLEFHWMAWISTVIILLIMTVRNYKTLMYLSSPSSSDMARAVLEFHQLYTLAVTLWMLQVVFQMVLKSMSVFFR